MKLVQITHKEPFLTLVGCVIQRVVHPFYPGLCRLSDQRGQYLVIGGGGQFTYESSSGFKC